MLLFFHVFLQLLVVFVNRWLELVFGGFDLINELVHENVDFLVEDISFLLECGEKFIAQDNLLFDLFNVFIHCSIDALFVMSLTIFVTDGKRIFSEDATSR